MGAGLLGHFRSNVVGYIALFLFAVSGVAEALPGKNSVDSGDIRNNQVRSADIGNGQVKAADVGPGQIGSAHLTPGSVGTAHLSFAPATQAELIALLDSLSGVGSLNSPSNPVDWTKLKGVPAGIADGTDDTGGTASDVSCGGCVGSGDLADGAALGEIGDDDGSGSNLDADRLDGLESAQFWKTSGNAGTVDGTDFIGTTDNVPFSVRANNLRALRIEPNATSPNITAGYHANSDGTGTHGVTIAGGGESARANDATANFATISGGSANHAEGIRATVGGGADNRAGGASSTVAGGYINEAGGNASTVGGGQQNEISSGFGSTIPGGYLNEIEADFGTAMGYRAIVDDNGSFVYGDTTIANISSPAANTFSVRASGGIWLGTTSSPSIPAGRFLNTSTGAYLSTGGTWTNSSDAALKSGVREVDPERILDALAELPVSTWEYDAESGTRHIGPMAQDFAAAFGVGADDRHIASVDADGVALAAIKGLDHKVKELEAEIAALRSAMERG